MIIIFFINVMFRMNASSLTHVDDQGKNEIQGINGENIFYSEMIKKIFFFFLVQ
jgi:hypothetical protein